MVGTTHYISQHKMTTTLESSRQGDALIFRIPMGRYLLSHIYLPADLHYDSERITLYVMDCPVIRVKCAPVVDFSIYVPVWSDGVGYAQLRIITPCHIPSISCDLEQWDGDLSNGDDMGIREPHIVERTGAISSIPLFEFVRGNGELQTQYLEVCWPSIVLRYYQRPENVGIRLV